MLTYVLFGASFACLSGKKGFQASCPTQQNNGFCLTGKDRSKLLENWPQSLFWANLNFRLEAQKPIPSQHKHTTLASLMGSGELHYIQANKVLQNNTSLALLVLDTYSSPHQIVTTTHLAGSFGPVILQEWGVAKGSSISWVAQFRGERQSE